MKKLISNHLKTEIPYQSHSKNYTLNGFTLIELLVVLAIISTLLTLAMPRYFNSLDISKETVLRANLMTARDAIDKYYADQGIYPESLTILVGDKYLRTVPVDPITESSETWVFIFAKDMDTPGVYDIHSGATGLARDGTTYSKW